MGCDIPKRAFLSISPCRGLAPLLSWKYYPCILFNLLRSKQLGKCSYKATQAQKFIVDNNLTFCPVYILHFHTNRAQHCISLSCRNYGDFCHWGRPTWKDVWVHYTICRQENFTYKMLGLCSWGQELWPKKKKFFFFPKNHLSWLEVLVVKPLTAFFGLKPSFSLHFLLDCYASPFGFDISCKVYLASASGHCITLLSCLDKVFLLPML